MTVLSGTARAGAGRVPADTLYDPLAPDVLADPYPVFDRLRASGPVRWHDRLDSWVVTGHAECAAVLRATSAFTSDFRRIGDEVPESALSIQMLDPPEHGPIRHLLAAAVRAQGLAALEGDLTAIAERRIAAVRDVESFDFVADVARPAALDIVCHVLGVDPPDGPEFEATSNAIVRSMDGGLDPDRVEPGRVARGELSQLVAGWLAEPRGDGLVAHVARHRDEYEVSADLAANSLRAVLHAGYESASRLVGNAALALTRHPWLVSRLRDERLRRTCVDELVRYDPPVQADARACVADAELGGQTIRRAEVVVLLLGAANHDPAEFPDPGALVPDRAPNRHLGFGLGAHACLGAQLAAIELRAILRLLSDGRRLVPAGPPVREPTATLRGLTALPVRWTDESEEAG